MSEKKTKEERRKATEAELLKIAGVGPYVEETDAGACIRWRMTLRNGEHVDVGPADIAALSQMRTADALTAIAAVLAKMNEQKLLMAVPMPPQGMQLPPDLIPNLRGGR